MIEKLDVNLLLVEDDKKIRESLARTLNIKVREIFQAENPIDAFEILKNNTVDIIVTDIEMPEMDGLTFVESLRKLKLHMPVIITSAFVLPDYFKKAIDLRIDKYLTKPVKISDLFDAVENSYNRLRNEKLQKKNNELEDKILDYQSRMSTIGEMVGNISHQWRQPLSTISTVVTELKFMKELDDLSDELLADNISIIQKNIGQMSQTMDDFRELIIGDQKHQSFDVVELTNQVLNISKAIIVTNFIKVIFNNEEQILLTNLKNALMQAMVNIINNAKDALLDTKEENRIIFIDITQDEKNVIIQIKDTAGGIKSKTLEKVFEVLYTTKEKTGMGIGLYMTKKLINEKMNGEISVSNETITYNDKEYLGASFKILLPKK
ncbi:MAG: response regulator [Sulfurovum sp.]|jgi:signal transduction histidine kinase